MGREGGEALPKRVETVRQGIEAWRAQRPKLAPMPDELWSAAVGLAREHGVYAVARSLRVDYGALKRRVGQAEEGAAGREWCAGGFVQVSGSQLLETESAAERSGTADSVVELMHADGSRMVVRLGGGEPVDVVGLAGAFWRRGA